MFSICRSRCIFFLLFRIKLVPLLPPLVFNCDILFFTLFLIVIIITLGRCCAIADLGPSWYTVVIYFKIYLYKRIQIIKSLSRFWAVLKYASRKICCRDFNFLVDTVFIIHIMAYYRFDKYFIVAFLVFIICSVILIYVFNLSVECLD